MTHRAKKLSLSVIFLFLALLPAQAQDQPVPIKLAIKRNGKSKPIPAVFKLRIDTTSADLLVQGDQLLVPVVFARAENFTLFTILNHEEIRIENLSARELKFPNWTILLADHQYDDPYRASVPNGADIRSSCLLSLTSADNDQPNIIFVPYCRVRPQTPPPSNRLPPAS
jgi:hypothetical protein